MTKKKATPPNLIDRFDRPPLKGMPKMVTRPGSMEILKQPSRMGNSLFYPDGRVVRK